MARATLKDIKAGKTLYVVRYGVDENGTAVAAPVEAIYVFDRPYRCRFMSNGKERWRFAFLSYGKNFSVMTGCLEDYELIPSLDEDIVTQVAWTKVYTTRNAAKKAADNHSRYYHPSPKQIDTAARFQARFKILHGVWPSKMSWAVPANVAIHIDNNNN